MVNAPRHCRATTNIHNCTPDYDQFPCNRQLEAGDCVIYLVYNNGNITSPRSICGVWGTRVARPLNLTALTQPPTFEKLSMTRARYFR